MQDAHKRAFVVAKMTKADLLTDVRDSLQKALDEGKPFEEWKKEIVPKLEGKWLGRSVGELWDELSDEEKAKREPPSEKQREKIIAPERLELIFRTNMAVANAAGHYEQLMKTKAIYPYWRYVTRDDARVRDAHRALHNKVFKWDDPFWETYFPPNGFRCRCHVSPLTKRQVERDPKLHIEQSNIAEDADGRKVLDVGGSYYKNNPGWDYNPGDGVNHLVSLAKSNEKGRPAQVQADMEADLAKKEAEEQRKAAEAAARAEAERLAQEAAKARAEAERKAQEIEQRLQEAQARAAQRQAQRQAKQAQEAERREKEAEKRRQTAEAAAQKEALQEAQRREAERLRDAEVQKVLRQAREVQGAPVLRQTAKTAEIKIDTYVVQDKVRLRKDTPVPAKEERKVVRLAQKIEWKAGKRQFKQSADDNLPLMLGNLYRSGKAYDYFEVKKLSSVGDNNLKFTNSKQLPTTIDLTAPGDESERVKKRDEFKSWATRAIKAINERSALIEQKSKLPRNSNEREEAASQLQRVGEKLNELKQKDYVVARLTFSFGDLKLHDAPLVVDISRFLEHAYRGSKVDSNRVAPIDDVRNIDKNTVSCCCHSYRLCRWFFY